MTHSYSTHRRSHSPPTDNRNSFAPYNPEVDAALEHLWERFEDTSYQNDQRRSQQ